MTLDITAALGSLNRRPTPGPLAVGLGVSEVRGKRTGVGKKM